MQRKCVTNREGQQNQGNKTRKACSNFVRDKRGMGNEACCMKKDRVTF